MMFMASFLSLAVERLACAQRRAPPDARFGSIVACRCLRYCLRRCDFLSPATAASSFDSVRLVAAGPAAAATCGPAPASSRQRRIAAWLPDSSTSGTALAFIHLRPRVMRAIEQAVGERILLRRLARRSARPAAAARSRRSAPAPAIRRPTPRNRRSTISSSTSRSSSRSSMPS